MRGKRRIHKRLKKERDGARHKGLKRLSEGVLGLVPSSNCSSFHYDTKVLGF